MPNRLTVERQALLDAIRRVRLMARENSPVRLTMKAERPRAAGHHPGRRRGGRGARRQVRGQRAHRGVQPRVPHRRPRGRPRATRSRSRPSTRQARGAALDREHGLPLPAHARPGVLTASPAPAGRQVACTSGTLADRLPVLRRGGPRAPRRPHAVLGPNGQGKTNLLEAVGYLATLRSFRGAPTEALVRRGRERAVVRGEVVRDDGREHLIEAEIARTGRNRVLVNKQRLARTRDLLGVGAGHGVLARRPRAGQGRPGLRRTFLDDLLVALHPKHDAGPQRLGTGAAAAQRPAEADRTAGPTRPRSLTLDVWDAKLAEVGERAGRRCGSGLVERVWSRWWPRPTATSPAGGGGVAALRGAVAEQGLAAALVAARRRRAATGRDPGRSPPRRRRPSGWTSCRRAPTPRRASNGRWRWPCGWRRTGPWSTSTASPPVLLLDDVFSELDPERSAALLRCPAGGTDAAVLRLGAARRGWTPTWCCTCPRGRRVLPEHRGEPPVTSRSWPSNRSPCAAQHRRTRWPRRWTACSGRWAWPDRTRSRVLEDVLAVPGRGPTGRGVPPRVPA